MNAIRSQKNAKKGFDRSVTVRSNGTLPFVCNKTDERGVGVGKRLLDDQHFYPDFMGRQTSFKVACDPREKNLRG